MSEICVVGIDPGAKGAVAVLRASTETIYDMPQCPIDYLKLGKEIASATKDCTVYTCIEKVHALPHQSTVAGFTFGKNCGYVDILAHLFTKPFNIIYVTPQKWKKYFGLSKDKKESIRLARELFPASENLLTASKDGRAEALLLGEYFTENAEELTKCVKKLPKKIFSRLREDISRVRSRELLNGTAGTNLRIRRKRYTNVTKP